MDQSRREFLIRTSCAALGAAALSSGMKKFGLISAMAETNSPTDYRALVCIFLSGGNDGNNMVVPLDTAGYDTYYTARNASGLALPKDVTGGLLPITPSSLASPFGLHPSLSELQTLFGDGHLAVVCNVGPLVQPISRTDYKNGAPRPYQLFSHSDQVAQWQTSRADTREHVGWGGRTGDFTLSFNNGSSFPIVTSTAGQQLFGIGLNSRPLAISPAPTPLNQVLVLSGFSGSSSSVARRTAMDAIRGMDAEVTMVAATSDATQQAITIGQALSSDPALTTVFPATRLGNQLKQVAKLISLNQTSATLSLNRQIFFCNLGGFDTHQNQLANQASLLTDLSQSMKAFYDATVELGVDSRVTTFTLSDFGRTLQPSGSGAGSVGSDHGWGNHQFVLGSAVTGGDFYGVPGSNATVYPTLTLGGPDDTDTRGRWIPTCAIEQYAATLARWYGLSPTDVPTVFPLLDRFDPADLGFLT
jgi:uncharacterized protein (DUF1501 family)